MSVLDCSEFVDGVQEAVLAKIERIARRKLAKRDIVVANVFEPRVYKKAPKVRKIEPKFRVLADTESRTKSEHNAIIDIFGGFDTLSTRPPTIDDYMIVNSLMRFAQPQVYEKLLSSVTK